MYQRPGGIIAPSMYRRSILESLGFIFYAVVLYLAPLGLATYSAIEWPSLWFTIAPMIGLSSYGLFVLATVGHEGFHFNLSEHKLLSCFIGCFFSSAMPFFCAVGFFVYHWDHHNHNNTSRDPDYMHFTQYQFAFPRIAIARLVITFRYFILTFKIAVSTGKVPGGLPLKKEDVRRLAIFNLASQFFWLGIYSLVFWLQPLLIFILIPIFLSGLFVSSLNAFQEHAFQPEHGVPFARTRSSALSTLLHAGSNYHVEHHLYPGIPCWRLGKVHRILLNSGWYDDKQFMIERQFFKTFAYCFARYRYGGKL